MNWINSADTLGEILMAEGLSKRRRCYLLSFGAFSLQVNWKN